MLDSGALRAEDDPAEAKEMFHIAITHGSVFATTSEPQHAHPDTISLKALPHRSLQTSFWSEGGQTAVERTHEDTASTRAPAHGPIASSHTRCPHEGGRRRSLSRPWSAALALPTRSAFLATSDVDPATRSTPLTTSLLSNSTASPQSRLTQAILASPSTSPPSPVLVEGKNTSTSRSSNHTVDCRHVGGDPRPTTRLTAVGSDRALALRIRNRFAPLLFDLPQQGCTLRHSALGQRE